MMSEYEANIRECVSIILSTKPGERQMLPEFGCGIYELLFTPNTPAISTLIAHQVKTSLERWEPRIEVADVSAWPDAGGTVRVSVSYTIRSTLTEQELSLFLTSGG